MTLPTTEQIGYALALATGVAGGLGILGHAFQAIPWPPIQHVGGVLVAVYSNFGKLVEALQGKSLPAKKDDAK